MHLTDLVRNRLCIFLAILAILCFCGAAWVLLSGNSHEPFTFDELYGLLD